MIRFSRVVLEDFGVFKGRQEIDLPEGDGVVVIYGDNGKGKTTLLNAFRWAFTGEVLERSGEKRPTQRLVNREASSSNPTAGCTVQIDFSSDSDQYQLTRRVEFDTGGAPHVRVLLKQGTSLLNKVQADAELARLLPPETQQFFFFDGELLNQFEGLLRDDEIAGDKLKASIERLLGVPIVQNAASDCRQVADDATEKLEAAAKLDLDNAEAGRALEQTRTLRKAAQDSAFAEAAHIEQYEQELEGLGEQLSQHERTTKTMGEIDAQQRLLAQVRVRLEEDQETLRQSLTRAWAAALTKSLSDRLRTAEDHVEETVGARNRAAFATELRHAVTDAPDAGCPACGTSPLLDSHRDHLTRMTSEADSLSDLDARLVRLRAERDLLRSVHDTEAVVRITEAEKKVRTRRVECDDLTRQLKELDASLGDVKTDDLKELIRRRQEIGRLIDEAKGRRSEAEERANSLSSTEAGLRKKLSKFSDSHLPADVRHQDDLGRRLSELFARGVDQYREQVLRGVEDGATRLFVEMRSEQDFKGLEINERYGLEILDERGKPVGERSAGYEHLVALALIGGLQACSTISGPVVMDSPFGRLDPTHVQQVASNLNKLSKQVILLVHEREINPFHAAEMLKGHLLTEYSLVRRTSTNTRIDRRVGT